MDILKKLVFWIVLILVIAWAVVLGIYTEIAISFAWLSIAIAVFFAIRSLNIANDSLKLTLNTVRPFMSVQPGNLTAIITPKAVTLSFEIKNAGVLPGELVHMDIAFFGNDEIITNDNISKEFPIKSGVLSQPILFPNSTYHINYTIDISADIGKRIWETMKNGKVKIRHCIKYKGINTEYITIQSEQLDKKGKDTLRRNQISPYYWT